VPTTFATAGEVLLRDVLERPADDAPRLILADWLDEHGGRPDQAEFIRLQLELARLGGMLPAARFDGAGRELGQVPGAALLRRERELWDAHAAPGVGTRALAATDDCRWRRGFVDEVRLPCADFLREGVAAALFAAHPVTRAGLSDREPLRTASGQCVWFREAEYHSGHLDAFPYVLPPGLYAALEGGLERAAPYCLRRYAGEAAARNALSAACVSLGRAAAGLGP
jgi:uncharacterized protein (TIGR02996 family)